MSSSVEITIEDIKKRSGRENLSEIRQLKYVILKDLQQSGAEDCYTFSAKFAKPKLNLYCINLWRVTGIELLFGL